MTINEIKKAVRDIEISYDYNHSKNDYDIVLNLTELANLIKTLQDKAIDDFVKFANTMPTIEEEDGEIRPMWLEEMAEQLKKNNKESEIYERKK